MRILVVEDERKVAAALQQGLQNEGYDVSVAGTGEDGFFLVNTEVFDLVLLDVMLPGRDGLEVLSAMRKSGLHVPVLILTARDALEDRVQGLDSGADDYLVKPFAFPELLARIRALLRRGKQDVALRLGLADLDMDVARRTVTRSGEPLDLTAREFELLQYLVEHVGRVVSRETMAREVWKETSRHSSIDNVIDVTVARLRRKLDDPFDKKLLHTVRGVGFVIKDEGAGA